VRTADSIQSNVVHLSHIYCFTQLGLTLKPSKEFLLTMIKFMIEEELRRRQEDWRADKAQENLVNLLQIDVSKYMKVVDDKLQEEHKSNEQLNPKDLFDVPIQEIIKDDSLDNLNPYQKAALVEYS